MTFGEWLRDRRKSLNMTQDDLADKADCSKSYISTLERDATHTETGEVVKPSPKMIEALAEALEASPREVYGAMYGSYSGSDEPIWLAHYDEMPPSEREEVDAYIEMRYRRWRRGKADELLERRSS